MKKKLLISGSILAGIATLTIIFYVFFTPKGTIDSRHPEYTAKNLSHLIGGNGEYQLQEDAEYNSSFRDTYNISENISFFLDENENNIEQLNFGGITDGSVRNVLEMIGFPQSSSVDSVLAGNQEHTFVQDEGVGVSVQKMNEEIMNLFGYLADNRLTIIYNEERFEDFENR